MRLVIWLLVIFATSACVALFGVDNNYVVVFFMKKNSYRISFNFFVIIALISLLAAYWATRIIAGALNLPGATRRWQALRRERHSHADLNESILQYLAGRYSRTVKSANKAIKAYEKSRSREESVDGTIEFGVVAYLMAAAGAHRLQDKEAFHEQLEYALKLSEKSRLSDAPDAVRLQQVQWLIEDNDPRAARATIQKLDPGVARRIATLLMQLKIDRMEGATLSALHTVRQLVKHKAYEPTEAQAMISQLASQVLDSAQDTQQLKDMWEKLESKERKIPEVIAHAAHRYASLHDDKAACPLIASCWNDINTLADDTRNRLLFTLDMAMPGADESWLKRLEKANNDRPDDPMLTYLNGLICEQHHIEGRAQMLLDKAAQHEQLPTPLRQRALLALAGLAEKNGHASKASQYYKDAALLMDA